MRLFRATKENIDRFSHLERLPFTYKVTFKNPTTNEIQFYYGSKSCEKCHPSWLWNTYFTSSDVIEQLRNEFPDSCFKAEVRYIFPNNQNFCVDFEYKVQKRLKVGINTKWINQKMTKGSVHSTQTKLKISNSCKGRIWIKKENIEKYILSTDLHLYQDWSRGRLPKTKIQKEKLSKKMKGISNNSEKQKQIAKTNFLKNNPARLEHNRKIQSERMRGRILSIDARQKMSESGKGKIWVYKLDKSTKIQPSEKDNYLNDGWKLGRALRPSK